MKIVRKSKKRGITLIEVVMVVVIILILSSYSVIKYQGMRVKNVMDSDKLKITTGITNTNIRSADVYKTSNNTIMQDKTHVYFKLGNKGIIVLGEDPDNIGKLKLNVDSGLNTQKLRNKEVYTLFNCGEESGKLLPCPIMILESDPENIIDPTETGETIPENVTDSELSSYIDFFGGVPYKSFTIYTFDDKGIVKNRIKVVGKDKNQQLMLLEKYIYIGPKDSETNWNENNIEDKNKSILFTDKEVAGIWQSDDKPKEKIPVEIR
ncbi:MAG: prepilin-type N-terminal cleavage/methylation domain-containing protein [Fusobacteriaceae bacterium]